MINGRPNDQRGLIHRKILQLLPGGGVVDTVLDLIPGGSGGGEDPGCPPSQGFFRDAQGKCRRSTPSAGLIPEVGDIFGGGDAGCPPEQGFFRDEFGLCRQTTLGIGGATNGAGTMGCEPPLVDRGRGFCEFIGGPSGGQLEATQGRYGPANEPGFVQRNIRFCLDGQILGKDKLCYNKGAISNKERLYPKGRAPLLTGGEMAAIAKAAAAKNKVARTYKRLGLGKPTRRAPAAHAHARPVRAVSIPQ